jgi:UDP-glucose 4-epimerase
VALGQRDHVEIYGSDYPTPDGTCVRDYIHVEDLAAAHLLALEKLTPGMELKLNLGTGHGASVQEIVGKCRQISSHAIPARAVDRREGDPPQLVADASLAKQTLGWQPRYNDVGQIIESAWAWQSKHPNGYGD